MAPTAQVDIVLVQHLLNYWADRGINMDQVWPVLGIDPQSPLPRWVDTDRVADAYDYAARVLDDPHYPFDIGMYIARRDMPLQRMLRYAGNLRTGIEALLPFVYLTTGSLKYGLQDSADGAVLVTVERHPERKVSPLQLCAAVTILACVCRDVLGRGYTGSDLIIRAPEDLVRNEQSLSSHVGIQVQAASGFMVEISRDAWTRAGCDPQPVLFRGVLRELVRQDERFREHVALYNELKDILQMCLMRRNVSQEGVADQLGISVRNLQRRLRALGTTYQNLLDEARQGLAMKLICEGDMPLYEVAYMVGYTEPSAFYKAFRRWTGSTPGEYRQTYFTTLSAISGADE